MLCRSPSVFVHVTRPPTWIVTGDGAKAKFAIRIAAVAGAAAAAGAAGPLGPVSAVEPCAGAAERTSGSSVGEPVRSAEAGAAATGGANVQLGAAADVAPQAAVIRAMPRAAVIIIRTSYSSSGWLKRGVKRPLLP
jgi:hypothetical protein